MSTELSLCVRQVACHLLLSLTLDVVGLGFRFSYLLYQPDVSIAYISA